MQVLQTSVLVKYRPLYEFLQEHASDVAKEVQHIYVAAARVYYETGFRRYTRSLGWLRVSLMPLSESFLIVFNRTGLSTSLSQLVALIRRLYSKWTRLD